MTVRAAMSHAVRALCTLIACGALAAPAGSTGVSPRSMQHYQLLQAALARYGELAADPSLTRLPPLPSRSIAEADAYAGTAALHRLLVALGDLPASDPPASGMLDAAIIEGLKRFQKRHGLEEDGILGPATWRALTTPLSQRTHQIRRTLQRWEQLPPNPWRRAVFVNIPHFRLFGLQTMDEPEARMLRMNVIVGRTLERLRTPTFVADMTHVVFRPYWEVPHSIAARELLPAIRADAGYLQSHHFEVVDAGGAVVAASTENLAAVEAGAMRLRQRPGAHNALGAVKFMMPNPNNVYLHDTPEQSLFSRNRRAFSHGCVRVADPAALARFVLADQPEWTAERISAAMSGSEPLRVDLKEPVRVYFVYGTAIAREGGEVLFFDDVYGLDGG
jgi:murein L,D-transpeptidase YcbB/YkuD